MLELMVDRGHGLCLENRRPIMVYSPPGRFLK